MTKKDLLIVPAILLLGGAIFFFSSYTIERERVLVAECNNLQSVEVDNGTLTVRTAKKSIYRNAFRIVER